ncbi:MAG: T9SS type A sorting domain-containing protein, partial [Saprospiraceae bacterium]|nr:T9SS type A sorting domain-containing protein [Saprospiraceae bacterium]
ASYAQLSNNQAQYTIECDVNNTANVDMPAGTIIDFYCADANGTPTGHVKHSHIVSVPILANSTSYQQIQFTTEPACNAIQGVVLTVADTAANGYTQCICQTANKLAPDIENDIDLPIEWLNFEAKRTHIDQVKLVWATGSELDNKGFEIQRLLENETEFETISFINSLGDSQSPTHYSYNDNNASNAMSYYRIKQVDMDNTYTYSVIRAVDGKGNYKEGLQISIFPNPGIDALNIRFEQIGEHQTAELQITDPTGRQLYTNTITLSDHEVFTLEEVKHWAVGVYFVTIRLGNGEEQSFKFTKKGN